MGFVNVLFPFKEWGGERKNCNYFLEQVAFKVQVPLLYFSQYCAKLPAVSSITVGLRSTILLKNYFVERTRKDSRSLSCNTKHSKPLNWNTAQKLQIAKFAGIRFIIGYEHFQDTKTHTIPYLSCCCVSSRCVFLFPYSSHALDF